jgi:hypothetical protein
MLSLRKPDKRFDSLGRQEPNSQ